MPSSRGGRAVLIVLSALGLLAVLLVCLGARLAVARPDKVLYNERRKPVELLDTGDLLFFSPRVPVRSPFVNAARLMMKATIGTIYSHVSVVYRDDRGVFGEKDALYSFELSLDKGGVLLFPLRQRVRRSLGWLLCREIQDPRPPIDHQRLDEYVLEETGLTRKNYPANCKGATLLRWAKLSVMRHLLFMCPDPRGGGTCADYVLCFLEAAGLWSPEESCFCTSVSDLQFSADSSLTGLPVYCPPERITRLKGRKKRAPRHDPKV